ncbi:MAG TPA: hypothetical protein PK402_11565, partial [Tepidisphaeraceae bacterium]|nr:hypothetical protein [Tepidisphaeraceae bacterium]
RPRAILAMVHAIGKASSSKVPVTISLLRNGATHSLPELTAKELMKRGLRLISMSQPLSARF